MGGSNGAVHLLEGLTLNVRALFHLRMATARHEPLGAERKNQIGIVWNRPSNTLRALAWHPDGEHLLCGSWDFVARMFHSRTGRVVRQWQGHAHWVDFVAVKPSRGLLCTESSNGTVRVWSLDSTECLAVHDVGHADLGGLLVHDRTLYVTCQWELLSMPLDQHSAIPLAVEEEWFSVRILKWLVGGVLVVALLSGLLRREEAAAFQQPVLVVAFMMSDLSVAIVPSWWREGPSLGGLCLIPGACLASRRPD
ncbi:MULTISPECIES: WD40 repeat domain-containing protein [Myxococcus]|uniref:WD40 repeat domain-containing protein n=1 Tax=Myxococcus TaxID=32 RepID=UPI001F349E80|nr:MULTISPECIES: hypothetical protein [Myxococcus]WAM27023.1 hypothetical protein OZ403_02595 [Myxococcus sp. NMCA1]